MGGCSGGCYTYDRNRVQISGAAEQKANGLGDTMAMPIAALLDKRRF